MKVYINENSFPILSGEDCIDEYVKFVQDNLPNFYTLLEYLDKQNVDIYVNTTKLARFIADLDPYIKSRFNKYLTNYVQSHQEHTKGIFQYYQHSLVKTSNCIQYETILDEYSSLAFAIFHNDILIINFPNTVFTKRPLIPIIVSEYDISKPDRIENVGFIQNYIELFFEFEIKNIGITPIEFEKFKNEYLLFWNKFDASNWNPTENEFPAHDIIHKYLKDEMEVQKKDKGFNEKVGIHLKWCRIMAILNFYQFDAEVSKLNPNYNHIFSAGSGSKKIYLSTDIQHGEMEICKHNGDHLCEVYNIDKGKHPEKNFKKDDAVWKTHCIKVEK